MRFIGDYSAKADAKGRVFLPAPFRKVLDAEKETRLILRADLFQKCLVLYPEGLWNNMLDTLQAKLNRWNGQHQHLLRQFLEDAEVVELDRNGRFLINKRKLKFAGDDHIEVWDKCQFESVLSEPSNLGADLQDIMAELPPNLI